MSIKLHKLIKELQRVRDEYFSEFDKEPLIWGMDTFDNEVSSIELCHSYRKSEPGYTASDIKEFEIEL